MRLITSRLLMSDESSTLLQGVLSRMLSQQPAGAQSLAGAHHRRQLAAALAASGQHQQQLRHAIGQIVRPSSRCDMPYLLQSSSVRVTLLHLEYRRAVGSFCLALLAHKVLVHARTAACVPTRCKL
jgi:hypothetical protein